MTEIAGFSKQFTRRLSGMGIPLDDLALDLGQSLSANAARAIPRKPANVLAAVIKRWSGLPRGEITSGRADQTQEITAPLVAATLENILNPWIKLHTAESLPAVRVTEVMRETGLSREQVLDALYKYPPTFSVNGSVVRTDCDLLEVPKPTNALTLRDCRRYGLNPKRVVRDTVYRSRKPGSNVVVKSGLQKRDIPGKVATAAAERAKITFKDTGIPSGPNQIKDAPKIRVRKTDRDWSTLIQMGINPNKIQGVLDVLYTLENMEFRTKPLPARTAVMERLAELAMGREVPVPIFNCFTFKWLAQGSSYPKCRISPDMTTAITVYYQGKIDELNTLLSSIGNPRFRIIVPDTEALDPRIWDYDQPLEERQQLVCDVKTDLACRLGSIKQPNLKVLSWSEFCQEAGLPAPETYTNTAYGQIKASPRLVRTIASYIGDGKVYFSNYLKPAEVNLIAASELKEQGLWYSAMYFGEGMAATEARAFVINFEEGRVAKWMQLGAEGNLALVTPIDNVDDYYKWKNTQPRLRIKQNG